MIGDTQVGKSCIIERFTNNKFKSNTSPTIGAAFQTRAVNTERGTVTLQIWDTAGQEKYRALAPLYFRAVDVAVLCFDVGNINSFMSLGVWIEELKHKAPEHAKIVFAGNKVDVGNERVVEREKAAECAESNGAVGYMEVSAKTGDGIEELFELVANAYLDTKKASECTAEPVNNAVKAVSSDKTCC